MNLHNELLSRVKRTWEMLRPSAPPHKPSRSADHLIKMNLPPLLGRRDAAYDCVSTLIADQELFARDEAWRQKHYGIIAGLLESAAEDTKSILRTLSSPDTASREQDLYDLIALFRDIVQVLEDFTRLGSAVLNEEHPTFKRFGIRYTDAERLRGDRLVSDVELSTVNQLRVSCSRALPTITRSREYTAKSFSKPYASRYQKAYDAYTGIFREAAGEQ